NAVKTYCKALWDSCVQIGGPQIRNLGTIGGNYCCNSPAADTVPAILALNCKIEYVEDLAVAFVFKKDNNRCGFRKVGKRNALAISSVTMAMNKSSNGEITVAVGCCGPSVIVCKKTSACLTEKKDIKEAKNLILTEISPIDDKWGTVEYKNIVCRNFLEDLYKEVVL
ncbi:MAG: FAD binding domain-containing protein, partial [Sphaerochaetaceae bacterium]|nr:FAD binding domain-containing protein [Sphaerochaetaceae bacterium]